MRKEVPPKRILCGSEYDNAGEPCLRKWYSLLSMFVSLVLILLAGSDWVQGETFNKTLDPDRKQPENIFRLCSSLDKIAIGLHDLADAIRQERP